MRQAACEGIAHGVWCAHNGAQCAQCAPKFIEWIGAWNEAEVQPVGWIRIATNDMTERGAPCRTASFYLERTLDRPVVGYTHGSRWNGWATPMFDRDTAMQVMRAVNDANEGEDDQISISYDESRDHLRGTGWQGMTVI